MLAPRKLPRRKLPRLGTSMVEVVVSTLLVSVVMLAALNSAGSVAKATRVGSIQSKGYLLAQALIDEILAMPYEDRDTGATVVFGIESNEPSSPGTRATFDDIDDYIGWSSVPEARDGRTLAGATGWTRAVAVSKVQWQTPTTALSNGQTDEGVRRITVTVTSPAGVQTNLVALCGKYGSLQQTFGLTTTAVTAVGIRVIAGGEELDLVSQIANHANGP